MVNVTELNRKPELDLSALNGADLDNAAENQILVTQGDGTLAVETQAEGPNPYDQAQTFTESDVTVTNTNTVISSGSIKLLDGDTTDTEADDDTFSGLSSKNGVVINPNRQLTGLTLDLSANTAGATSAYVRETDGTQLASESISSGSASFSGLSLQADTDYFLQVDADGSNYDVGVDSNASFPYSGVDLDITAGVFGTSTDSGNRRAIRSVTGSPVTSGNALIEWDRGIPTDIYSWDVATFTRTLDGETVTVDVEDGNGNVLLSDIDRNTDISSIADQTNIKLRANLSRNDTNNNPTLDSAYRSWFV